MNNRAIFVTLTHEAASRLDPVGPRNSSGVRLRDWLIRRLESATFVSTDHPSLFSTPIQVEVDVPVLLDVLARVTNQKPDEVIEAWLADQSEPESPQVIHDTALEQALPEGVIGRIAELLDLAGC
jgi:hypothetical protein